VHHLHAFGHSAKWRETLAVEYIVVAEVDKELRGARVGPGCGEGDCATSVAAFDRIVGDSCLAPFCGYARIAVNAELAHETWDHAKKSGVFEVAGTNEIVKTVRTFRSKRPGNLDGEFALGCVELRLERLRRLFSELARIGKTRRCGFVG